MKNFRYTKVWIIDSKLVVAATVNEAVNLFKSWSEGYEPEEIKCIKANVGLDGSDALIEVDKKDLKLTANDIGAILELYLQMMRDKKYRNIGREAICDEVLKRFYELDKNE